MHIVVLLVMSWLVLSCSNDDSNLQPQPSENTNHVVGQPSFRADVAKILNDNCVACHKKDGIGPFPLQTYAQALAAKSSMVIETKARRMPPFLADNSGSCQTYTNPRWLSNADLATLAKWADNPLEGDLSDTPQAPKELPKLNDPVSILDIGNNTATDYVPQGTPAHQNDDYRCFVVNAPVDRDSLVTAFEVMPGNERLVHHIILYGLPTAATQSIAEQLAADEPGRAGYTCFGESKVTGATFIGGWAPGLKVNHYPQGTGIKIGNKRKLVVQIHYNLAAFSGSPIPSDRTQIALKTVDLASMDAVNPSHVEAQILSVLDTTMQLDVGQESVSVDIIKPVPYDLTLYGVFPHMHNLGTQLKVTLNNTDCLLDVQNWNFNWQQFYNYTQPIQLNKNAQIKLTCTYNTVDAAGNENGKVTWGPDTNDEMCLNFFYTVPRI